MISDNVTWVILDVQLCIVLWTTTKHVENGHVIHITSPCVMLCKTTTLLIKGVGFISIKGFVAFLILMLLINC